MTLAPVRTAALAAAVLLALPAAAQSVVVRGTVSDADGPVRLARVVVQADDADGDTLGVDVTDAAGAFAVAVVGTPGEPAPPAAGYAVGRAFPNPAASGHVVVRYTTPGDRPERAEADVFDLLGRRATPGAPLPAGAYVVRLRFADGSVSEARKFVVARGGVRVAAEQAQGALDARAGAPAARLLVAAPVVFVTVERAGYVTETRAVDAGGGVALDVVLSPAPAPTATIAPLASVQAGTALTLDGTGSAGAGGEDLAYSWDFGDGQRGGAARVAHVYTAPGTYTVTLTVRGAFGATAQTTATVEVTDPPAAAGAAPVRLVVTGTTGGAVVGATVSVVGGAATATTDGEGVAVVGGVPTGVPVVLAVEAEGFATQRLALDLPAAAEQETTVEVTLAARQPARTLRRAEEGGAVVGVEGVRVELPVEGLVHADGTPAVGDVEVRLTPVDVSDPDEIGAFPGDFAGVTPDGRAPLILSYGVAEYVFEQAGEPLDLMPGKTATIEIPLYVAQDADGDDLAPGDPYPLWSLDETTGEWVLEGEGTVVASAASPTGLALRAEVSHFSWWNCDIAPNPYTTVPECGVGAENGLPTLQLDETCYIDGYIANTAGPRTRPNTTIGPNNDRGLPVPPGIDVVLEGSARGGTLRGEATVNGEAGRTGAVVIVLRPVGASAGGTIAPDTTLVGAIDPVGEEDTFTFATTAGRYVRVAVGRGQGSLLQGTVTVARPDGQAVQTEPFGALVGRVAFVAPTTGVYTITVDGTQGEPGTYTLDLIERSARQIAPGVTVTDAIDPAGDEDVFSFTATAGAYTRVAVGRGGGSFLTGTLTVVGPDGLALEPASFDSRTGQVSFTPETTGTYAAVVDGTGNGTGAYTLRLAEAVPQPLDVGTEATESVGPLGDLFVYRFTGTAGQPVDLYLGGEGVSTGRADVLGPDGEPVAGFAASVNTSAFARLPADGAYTVVVEVPNGPGTVVTSLRAVPTIAVGDEVTGALRAGERWSYLFSAAAGTLVRPAFADVSVEGTAGGASVFPLDGAQRDRRAFGVERLGGGTYRLQVLGGTRPSPSFTAAVAAIAAPAPLALDAQGRAVVTDAVETVGEVLLYRVETPVGSGLLARLAADGAGLAGATATVGVAPLQAGETVPRESAEVDGYGPSADRYEAQSDDGPAGLLETLGARLPDGVAYVVAVGAVRQFNSADAGDAPTGGFTLRTDVVAPAAAIEVDDDLAQCAGAATRSLHAAMFAATTGTTVTACAGRYAEAVSVPVLGGPTLAGTDRDGRRPRPRGRREQLRRRQRPAVRRRRRARAPRPHRRADGPGRLAPGRRPRRRARDGPARRRRRGPTRSAGSRRGARTLGSSPSASRARRRASSSPGPPRTGRAS